MVDHAIDFGFPGEAAEVCWAMGNIAPLGGAAEAVSAIKSCVRNSGGCLYPPASPCQQDIRETKKSPAMDFTRSPPASIN